MVFLLKQYCTKQCVTVVFTIKYQVLNHDKYFDLNNKIQLAVPSFSNDQEQNIMLMLK